MSEVKKRKFHTPEFKAKVALEALRGVETARANGLEPYHYLRHIFDKLPVTDSLVDYEALLPWNAKDQVKTSAVS